METKSIINKNTIINGINYYEYMQSEEWRKKQDNLIYVYKYRKCLFCSSKINIHCHHLTYEHFGDERDNEIIFLCKKCHDNVHEYSRKYNTTVYIATVRISKVLKIENTSEKNTYSKYNRKYNKKNKKKKVKNRWQTIISDYDNRHDVRMQTAKELQDAETMFNRNKLEWQERLKKMKGLVSQ